MKLFREDAKLKKKNYIVILSLISILLFAGCSAGNPTTPGISTNEEVKIKSVINEYFLAINNQNWNKARNYCVNAGTRYYATSQMESLVNSYYSYCYVVTVNFIPDIINISVTGNYAQVYMYYYGTVSACGYFYSDGYYTTYTLQKVGNSWKIN